MTRITIRLGPLAAPLAKLAKKKKLPLAEAARQLLAEGLGIEPPEMPRGLAALLADDLIEHQRRAANARWHGVD